MSSVMMLDKSMMGSMGMTPGASMPAAGMPGMMPGMSQMCVVPKCEIKIEKCTGGMKIMCSCEDEMSAATLQNMCKMMASGMCSLCCMMNGMMMCQCNLAMCKCVCTNTEEGVCITCTSGDKDCAKMCQACCECTMACMQAGCMCCVCFGGMPCCCGTN